MMPESLLLDLDGVLVRSEEAWFRTVADAGIRFRGRAVSRAEFEPTFGQGTAADVAAFGLGCSAAELDRFYVDTLPRHLSAIWVDPAAATLLAELRRRGLSLALVTNTVSPLAEAIQRGAGLRDAFDALACADCVERAKPAPDLPFLALARLGRRPEEAWFVGDSRFDRQAAEAAGVRFVGLGIDGDRRIEALGELLGLLDQRA